MIAKDTAILVEGLAKRYRLGRQRDSSPTLRDSIAHAIRQPLRRLSTAFGDDTGSPDDRTMWALRDVTFEIKQGEIVGLIGRNGAGKSTLLKILSRVTDPTAGWAKVRGRVGSMLEVGTGFHPELTGRENVYLNGSILGMKRAEIRRKFDEIVDFAGVAPFLDTPVKRYSSGMHMRLAFAVAANLEPDILMVDEVLAVGDAEFQRKCLIKMESVANSGRTVLFVSHNTGLIDLLCTRGIYLSRGLVAADDTASRAVGAYLQELEQGSVTELSQRQERRGVGRARLVRIEIRNVLTSDSGALITGKPARFTFHVTSMLPGMSCSFTIYDQSGYPVTFFDSDVASAEDATEDSPSATFECLVETLLLLPGRYRINAAIRAGGETQDHVEGASFFDVAQGAVRGRAVAATASHGSVFFPHRWTTRFAEITKA